MLWYTLCNITTASNKADPIRVQHMYKILLKLHLLLIFIRGKSTLDNSANLYIDTWLIYYIRNAEKIKRCGNYVLENTNCLATCNLLYIYCIVIYFNYCRVIL